MKHIKYFVFAGGFFLLTILLPQQRSQEQVIVSLSKPGESGFLNIKHDNGSISVTGYNGSKVIINASLADHKSSTGRSQKSLKEIIGLKVKEKDNNITISTNSDEIKIDIDIRVPFRFSNNISIDGTGDITIESVSGEMVLSNENGNINLSKVSGLGIVSSVNGNIKAQFDYIDQVLPLSFNSINGKVDLTLPENHKANLKLLSEAGQIFTDFNIDFDRKAADITPQSRGGLTGISINGWLNGSINGGGQKITAKSINGNIYLRKNK